MDKQELLKRTRKFAIDIVQFYNSLPNDGIKFTIGKQLIRSGTSVGANHRAACRGKSLADFVSKTGTVEEEADETAFWLDLLSASTNNNTPELHRLLKEANELTAIFTATGRTAKERLRSEQLSKRKGNPKSEI